MKRNPDTLKDDIPSGGMTRFTSVFGAIGNYGMIGGAGMFVAEHAVQILRGQHQPLGTWKIATVGATLVGAAFGAAYGIKEASDIQHYREALAHKVDSLNNKVTENEAKIAELYQAVQDKEKARSQTSR